MKPRLILFLALFTVAVCAMELVEAVLQPIQEGTEPTSGVRLVGRTSGENWGATP